MEGVFFAKLMVRSKVILSTTLSQATIRRLSFLTTTLPHRIWFVFSSSLLLGPSPDTIGWDDIGQKVMVIHNGSGGDAMLAIFEGKGAGKEIMDMV